MCGFWNKQYKSSLAKPRNLTVRNYAEHGASSSPVCHQVTFPGQAATRFKDPSQGLVDKILDYYDEDSVYKREAASAAESNT